jgi:hypothetical protein
LENFLLVAFQEKKATVGDAGNPSLLKWTKKVAIQQQHHVTLSYLSMVIHSYSFSVALEILMKNSVIPSRCLQNVLMQ